MTGAPMTRQQYQKVARRVRWYGTLLMWLMLVALLLPLWVSFEWVGPIIDRHGKMVRQEGVVGLLAVLVIGVVQALLVLVSLLPFWWVDRRYGLKCPHCGRSVTLRCHLHKVLRSGKCCLCQAVLFEPSEEDLPAPIDLRSLSRFTLRAC